MKLRNKITGEINIVIADEDYFNIYQDDGDYVCPVTLKELNEGWEDYHEEPKEYWYIDDAGVIQIDQVLASEINMRKSIGNYFESKEEAEKAVEKLKAWKRLKDARFEFGTIKYNLDEESSSTIAYDGIITIKGIAYEDFVDDLAFLFGGEE